MANTCLECGKSSEGILRAIVVREGTPEQAGSSRVTEICSGCVEAAREKKLGVYLKTKTRLDDIGVDGEGI